MWFVTWTTRVGKKREKEFLWEGWARSFYMKLARTGAASPQAIFERTVYDVLRRRADGTWRLYQRCQTKEEMFFVALKRKSPKVKYKGMIR